MDFPGTRGLTEACVAGARAGYSGDGGGAGAGSSYQCRTNEGAERGLNRDRAVYVRSPGVLDNLKAAVPRFNWAGNPL